MKWVKTEFVFAYNGKLVARTRMTIKTILGDIIVYQALSGKVFYHFLGDLSVIKDGKRYNLFGQVEKVPVDTIEEGVRICEEKWFKAKEIINSI